MTKTPKGQARALAERQHGVVSRDQVRCTGGTREAMRNWVRSGEWAVVTPHVLRLVGTPATFAQRSMAAVLDAGEGSVVSHEAAALLWGLPGFSRSGLHISRRRGTSGRRAGMGVLHEPRCLPMRHQTMLDGVPVTTMARTIFDLAGQVHPRRVERALDNALAMKLVDLDALRRVTIELSRHGRQGTTLMRRLLSERGAAYIPPASGLEALFFAVLVAAGIEPPDCQVDLGGEAWIGRVDYVYRRAKLVIEVDSDRHHSSKLDIEADARRDAALRAAGFRVLRIREDQLEQRPHEVIALVRSALEGVPA